MGKYTIEFTYEEAAAAQSWYDGSGSMLYAIASTGHLALGTMRPVDEDRRPLTDRQWFIGLAEQLEGEADRAIDEAHKRLRFGYPDDRDELTDDIDGLRSIMAKCRTAMTRKDS